MIIYFVRHANAGQSKTNPEQDARRPLDKEGIEQSTQMGRLLAAMDASVNTIVSSPLKRATQTAALIANEIGHDGKIVFSPALAPSSDFDQFRQLLHTHNGEEAVMVVGHNPNLSQFLSLLLAGGSTDKAIDLKKGAVARIDLDSRNRALLKWSVTPKLLNAIHDSVGTKSRPKTSRK
jgi:phosphohistidine phosphatase